MADYYNLKNVRDLLTEGFTRDELLELCFYEPEFKSLYEQLVTIGNKSEIIRKIIDQVHRRLQIDILLAAVKKKNPARYTQHQPYANNTPAEVVPTFSNDLGYGITIGGIYQERDLQAVSLGWGDYGNTLVKSGWLLVPQLSQCHAIAFFKVHVYDNGGGYIHLNDVSNPIHTIWVETDAGFRQEEEFHYMSHNAEVWWFHWK